MKVKDITHLHDALVSRALDWGSDYPKDSVQDLWIRLIAIEGEEGSLNRILESNNYGYVFMMLKNIVMDEHRELKRFPVDRINGIVPQVEDEKDVDMNTAIGYMEEALEETHWYDRKIFEDFIDGDYTYRSFEDKTSIARSSIHNTVTKVKQELKDTINEKFRRDN